MNRPSNVWAKIERRGENECWNYMGHLDKDGYGRIDYGGKKILTHRLIYEFTFGKILNQLQVLHHCDNPRCCNTKHLFLGTQVDNIKDMILKNRHRGAAGEKNSHCKLTTKQVIRIKKLYSSGSYTQKNLGIKFKVTQGVISKIIRGELWAMIK